MLDHRGVEMAAGARVDLDDATAGRLDASCVSIRCLIPLEDCERQLGAELTDERLEKRCLACARRAYEVEDREPIARRCAPVLRGESGVLREQIALQAQCPRGAIIVMVMIVMVVMTVVVGMRVIVIRSAAACRAH
jgi:hypothetical protein